MNDIDLIYYKIDDLAERCGKPTNHIFQYAAKGELKIMIWYEGWCLPVDHNHESCTPYEIINEGPIYYTLQPVAILPEDALKIIVPYDVQGIEITSFIIDNKKNIPVFEVTHYAKPDKYWVPKGSIQVKRDSIFFLDEDVKKLDAKFHDFTGKKAERRKNNKTDIFLPAERKSLIKIAYAIAVDAYEYVPGGPIPQQLAEDLVEAGISIKEKIIYGWLEEGHELRITNREMKDIDPSEKEVLVKVVYVMAIFGYGYDPEEKKSPTPKIIEDAAAKVDMSVDSDTVRKWLKEGKKHQK